MDVSYAAMGMCGGIVRSFVGIAKALKRKEQLRWKYLALTIILSAVIGAFTGTIYGGSYKLSLLAGYAGMDIIEGAYKVFARKTFL